MGRGFGAKVPRRAEDPRKPVRRWARAATRDIAMGEEITCSHADFIDGFVPGQYEEVE